MKRLQIKAFTLVELIVVITILAILGTIAFISVQSYSANARDSVRIANLTNMDKGLGILQAKDGTLPDPEGNITQITLSGSTLMTQGEMTQEMAEKVLKMSGDITDPVDGSNPIYTLSTDKKKYQVALFLEAEILAYSSRDRKYSVPTEILQNTHAADGKTFITKGNKLGIVLDDNETPVNQQTSVPATLELTTTTANHKIYLDDSEVVEGIGEELSSINPVSSCKRILETGGARSANGGDGVYTINPSGTSFSVYCDMTTDGGGWTYATMVADTITKNLFDTGNTNKITSLTNNISSKGTISDIWIDQDNKDIMLKCITDQIDDIKKYNTPFIIYQYLKSDILHLEKLHKEGEIFSSANLQAKWKNNIFTLDTVYGSSVAISSMYLRTIENSYTFLIPSSTHVNISTHTNRHEGSPAHSTTLTVSRELTPSNYCVSAIR